MEIGKFIHGLFDRNRPRQNDAPTPRRQWISNPWHAVSVVHGIRVCDAVRRANGKRYLSKDAPVLPLPGCDASSCTCGYRHYPDRRDGSRRDSDVRASSISWPGVERRRAPGRRVND